MLQGNSKLLREQVEAGDFFILEWLSDARRRSSLLDSTSPVQFPTPVSPSYPSTTSSTYATGSISPTTGSSLPTQGASSATSSSRLTNLFLSSLPIGFSGGHSSDLQLSEGLLHSGSQSPLGSQQEQHQQQEQQAGNCDLGGGAGAGAGGEHPSQVVVKQGWLYKLDRQGKTWNRRFFILKLNDTLLYYPKEPVGIVYVFCIFF
jgi:hypothetical protein